MAAESEVVGSSEPSPPSTPPRSAGPPGWAWGLLILLAALATLYRSGAYDYWFHLGAGRAIREHGFPHREVWCAVAVQQAPFLAGWPYQVALHEISRWTGDAGVALWRAGWTALAAALAVGIVRLIGAASWPAIVLGLLALAASRDALRVRPEQALLVLSLFVIYELERARRHPADRTRRLVPAQALWANLHPAWLLGPLVAWIYSILEWWKESAAAPDPAAPRPNRSQRWMILGLVLWAASVLTPTPLLGLATPLHFLEPYHLDSLAAPLDWLHRWSWSRDASDPFTALAAVWLLGWAVAGLRLWRAVPALALVSALTMALGFYSAQFRDLAAWTAWPTMALAFSGGGPGLLSRLRAGLGVLAGLVGLLWLLPSARFPLGIHPLTSSLPVRAVALADSARIEGLVMNVPESGGYILAVRGAAHLPLIDPRLRGADRFHEQILEAQVAPLGLENFLDAWPVSHAIVPFSRGPDDRLAANFSERLEWALVSYDDGGCLFVRWNQQPVLARRAYRYLTPSALRMSEMMVASVRDTGLARRLESELLRARASSPLHARASIWLGELALARGRPPDALRFLEEAERIAPDTPRLAIALGRTYERLGDHAKARAAFTRALHQPNEAEEARRMLETGS